MKRKLYVFSALLIVLLSACEKDNLKEPESILSGRITFQGQPIGVRSGGVSFRMFQTGFAFLSDIGLNIAQDGSFKATLLMVIIRSFEQPMPVHGQTIRILSMYR